VKKVEKKQNKGGGADITVSRGAEEAGKQRRPPDLAPLARVATARPSPPSPSSIPINGNKRGRRRAAGIRSGEEHEAEAEARLHGKRGGPPRCRGARSGEQRGRRREGHRI
jgi:hypothetical protein